MKLILYGINYKPEFTGVGKYSGELAEWLSKNGFDVHVITTHPYYPDWKVGDGYSAWLYKKENINGVEVFRAPIFVPTNPTVITRLLHLVSYSISSLPIVIIQIFWKPDIVLYIQPTLFASLGALILAKLSGAKKIMHIQDYEIDAMFGLGMMKQGVLSNLVKQCESWLMKRFDVVSTISYSMIDNAKKKGVPDSRLLFFPNWADTELINPAVDYSDLKAEWGFSENDKIILYAGNMGKKQGLELVLDAAERLKDDTLLQFVMVGAGAHVDVLRAEAATRGVSNIHFKPLLPWDRVPEMLAMADVHLVVQKCGVADVVLPSKLTNILAVGGHALVTAEKYTELGMLEERFPGIYKRIEPENSELLTETLRKLLARDLSKPNQIARDYAVEYLSVDKVLSRFEKDLLKAISLEKSRKS